MISEWDLVCEDKWMKTFAKMLLFSGELVAGEEEGPLRQGLYSVYCGQGVMSVYTKHCGSGNTLRPHSSLLPPVCSLFQSPLCHQ
jgi:hypothetical protein